MTVAGTPTETTVFDAALAAHTAWLTTDRGLRCELPGWRWRGPADETDELMLARCTGPTLDVGCGPGRLTAALRARMVPALGIDVSATAVRMTGRRGGRVFHGDVFGPVPDAGEWDHVLLADGNIGIGGAPLVLLARARELLAPGGSVIVEVDPPGRGLQCGTARIGPGRPFPWALVGADAVAGLAGHAGFEPEWQADRCGRWFAELRRR